MPRPVSSGQRYMPGLDGLRALAVLAVIAYHEQFGWAPGGLLGVGVFFTLSGFLITSILVSQWSADGRIRLGDFWLHRARRLLPALFVMLAVVTAWVTLADRARLASLRGAVGGRGDVHQQLVPHRQEPVLLRQVRPARPARPSVVAGGGGAVLPALAAAADRRADPAAQAQGCGRLADRADGTARGGVGVRDAAPVPARDGPDQGVRRHRHPRVRPADRRRPGAGPAGRP